MGQNIIKEYRRFQKNISMSHSGAEWSHNEIGLINSPNNNTDDDESLHSWLLYDSCRNDITNDVV